MIQDVWLEKHPYLQPAAEFHAQVAMAAAGIPSSSARSPNWDDYVGEYRAGIPLLRSSHTAIDFMPAEVSLVSLVESVAAKPLPEKLAKECRASDAQLRDEMNAPRRAVAWLLYDEAFRASAPGSASLPGLDCADPISLPTDKCFQDLARGRPVAPQLLPHLRRGTRDGPANRRRSRSLATTFLRLLRDALAIPANRMPVLRKRGRSSTLCDSDRGREISSCRLLPVLPGLSENL